MLTIKDWLVQLYSFVHFVGHPNGRRISPSCTVKGDVTIGKYTYIGSYADIRGVGSGVRIGNYCSIARGVKVMSSGQHHCYESISTFPFFLIDKSLERKDFTVDKGDVVIGNDVWIGVDAIIMPGVTIGDGAVIGAGSVVTKNIGAYEIVAGVPARFIRKRFSDRICSALQETRWWQNDYEYLKRYIQYFIQSRTSSEEEFLLFLQKIRDCA